MRFAAFDHTEATLDASIKHLPEQAVAVGSHSPAGREGARRVMSDAPEVKPGDWMEIGSMDAVVCMVRGVDSGATDLAAVCNPERPAVYQVHWNGRAWEFAHPMQGVYAEHAASIESFVQALNGVGQLVPQEKGPSENAALDPTPRRSAESHPPARRDGAEGVVRSEGFIAAAAELLGACDKPQSELCEYLPPMLGNHHAERGMQILAADTCVANWAARLAYAEGSIGDVAEAAVGTCRLEIERSANCRRDPVS